MDSTNGWIELKILAARSLPSKDLNGLADPYCKLYWKGTKYKSTIKKKSLSPVWNETFLLPFSTTSGPFTLHIEIWDYDMFGSNEFMASCDIDLGSIRSTSSSAEGWYDLKGPGASGQLNLKLRYLQKKQTASPTHQYPPSSQQVLPSSQIVVGQGTFVSPGMTPMYPSVLHPPMEVAHPGPSASYSRSCQSPDVNPSHLKEVKDILPQCSYAQIAQALRKAKNDKEVAIDNLLSEIVPDSHGAIATTQAPSSSSCSKPVCPATGCAYTAYNPQTAAPLPPPVSTSLATTTTTAYGMHPAPSYGPSQRVPHSGRKKALLIGINYTRSRCRLRGCINDVRRMKSLLIAMFGFPDTPNTMVCLTDDNPDPRYQPTRANISMAMRWLVAEAQPGDALWFHFSGHGAQRPDQSGMEEDGLDETILPCDFESAGQIVDDEVQASLAQPLPSGCRLTAVMDCCHSGTGLDLPFCWNSKRGVWEEEDNPFYVPGDAQLFSGCRDDQTSADAKVPFTGEAGGAMTMAFVSVLSANPFGLSYASLLDAVKQHIKNRGFSQRPQLTATQRFDISRPFNLTDNVPNQSPQLGRQMRRRRRRKTKTFTPGAGGMMMGVGGGLLAGLLLGELLD